MEVSNKGFLQHKDFHKEGDNFVTGSMTISNGKKEDGTWDNEFINVIAFGEMKDLFLMNLDRLVNITGTFRYNKWTNKEGQEVKTPQIIINTIDGVGRTQPSQVSNQPQPDYSTGQPSPFGETRVEELADDDLPF